MEQPTSLVIPEGERNIVPVAEVNQHTTLSHADGRPRLRSSVGDGRDSVAYRGSAEDLPQKGWHRIGKSVQRGLVSRLYNKQYFRDWSLRDSDVCHTQSATLRHLNKIFAATLYIFFAQLLPALTFGFFTQEATNGEMGVIETILSMAIGGSLFALFAGQPMVVVGVTGPICLFCVGLYQQAKANGASFYAVMFFTCMWAASMHFVVALLGLCETFPKYITGFSADSFGVLIGLIYIYEGINQLISIWSSASLSASLFSLVLALGTLEVTRFLANLRNTQLFGAAAREMLADYAAIIVIVAMSACQLIPTLTDVGLPLINVPSRFTPSTARPWVVVDDITGASPAVVFSCIGSGFILSALLWFDHNISALLSRKENKNKEGGHGSYDWDFMLLGVSVFICGIFCLPPNYGLLPQAPLHVKHLTYLDSAAVVDDDTNNTDTTKQKKTIETRWSALLQSALMWSLLSSDLLLVIGLIPKGVLAGLFVFVGIEGLRDNHLTVKFIRMLSPNADDDEDEAEETSQKRIGRRMTYLQIIFVFFIFGITFSPALLAFPIFIVSLVVVQMGIDRYGFSSTPEESQGAIDFHDGKIHSHEAEICLLEGAIRALDSEDSLEAERVNEALRNRLKEWSLSRRNKKWEEEEKSRNVNFTHFEITLGFPRFCKWFFDTAGRRPVQRRKILLAVDPFIESKNYFEDERHAGEDADEGQSRNRMANLSEAVV